MLSKRSSTDKPVETIDTLIGQKSEFKGDLEFSGGLRVDGKVKGNISATDKGNSTLVLSELGEVQGNIMVPHIIINGSVNGNVTSGGKVELQAKAQITGDVHYRAIEMELGSTVNGNLVCVPEKADGAPLKSVGSSEPAASSKQK
ncbi:polymer-forming cytoskeletal protein [Pseudomonadota bacterium]